MIEINKIYEMDYLAGLKMIDSFSVDLVLTDPPYNLDFSSYSTMKLYNRKIHYVDSLKWDKKFKFDLKQASKLMFKEFDRILKKSGSIVMFGPQEWAYYYYEPAIKRNFHFNCELIWIKSNPIPQIRQSNYRSTHEIIVWFSRERNKKKKLHTFNWQGQQEMKNVFTTPILQGKERIRNGKEPAHPTQKPLSIIRKLIKIHSNENDLVVDCFAGSGTTLVACKQLNRKFIGFEINPKYVKIANERLQDKGQKGLKEFLRQSK